MWKHDGDTGEITHCYSQLCVCVCFNPLSDHQKFSNCFSSLKSKTKPPRDEEDGVKAGGNETVMPTACEISQLRSSARRRARSKEQVKQTEALLASLRRETSEAGRAGG